MTKKHLTLLMILLFSTLPFPAEHALGDKVSFMAGIDSDGIQRVDLLGGEYFFKPDSIIVKVNVPVEFRVRKKSLLTPYR